MNESPFFSFFLKKSGGHSTDHAFYAYSTLAGLTLVAVANVAMLVLPHEHEHRHEFTHMHQMRKQFPWGDGQTPLFGLREEAEEH